MATAVLMFALICSSWLVRPTCAQQPLPASCQAGLVLAGSPFHFALPNNPAEPTGGCSLEGTAGPTNDSYTVYQPGRFNYSCMGGEGQVLVVRAHYSIVLCQDCPMREHIIQLGDIFQWSLGENVTCSAVIQGPEEQRMTIQDTFFEPTNPGTYRLYCQENETIAAIVTVASSDPPSQSNRYVALLYTHAAMMAAIFGILLPLGAFLAHHKVLLAHKIIQPVGLVLAVVGMVLVFVYVGLSSGNHFHNLHGIVGLVLLVTSILIMPTLLLTSMVKGLGKVTFLRAWHRRCGHAIVFFGMGNVLLGLTTLQAPRPSILVASIFYGIWLLVAIVIYIVFSPQRKQSSSDLTKSIAPLAASPVLNTSVELDSRKLSLMSAQQGSEKSQCGSPISTSCTKGPQPLKKSVISEEKMIQLRKKSLDFLEARRQREMLDIEYGLTQPVIPEQTMDSNKSGRLDSKSDSLEDDTSVQNTSLPLHMMPSSPELPSPLFPAPTYLQKPSFTFTMASGSSDSSDSEDKPSIITSASVTCSMPATGKHTRPVRPAKSFSHNPSAPMLLDDDSDSDPTGSLRITRHSRRARKSTEDIFRDTSSPVPDSSLPRPCASPLPNNTNRSRRMPTSTTQRRRKPALIPPPIITTTPVDSEEPTVTKCPFPRGSSESRGNSPCPSSDGVFDSTPKPRRKKVSVAATEATVFPPTPISLEPPRLLTRSSSFSNRLRPQEAEAAFVDNALRSVMLMSHEAIICANSNGEIVFWSQSSVRMFGYTPGEAIGSSLDLIIPSNYKDKHDNGISRRTEDTLKYMKKHSYTPEEQKHARLYEVHGRAKNGHEFPVEVNVTSFVIDGELFYTGVIIELVSKKRGRSRANSFSSASDMQEATMKQRALAVGAQMKIAHKLASAEYIAREELQRVLSGSLQSTQFAVEPYQMDQMVDGIMKAGDPKSTGAINFVNLIQLLSKFRLYISESGLIARYGKTKGAESRLTMAQSFTDRVKHTFKYNLSFMVWILVYLLLNVVLFVGGFFSTNRQGWQRWAYGCGPVLSLNLVLVVLPVLTSLINAMRNSKWMNKCFPLTSSGLFHRIISIVIFIWTGVHLFTHIASFVIDGRNTTESNSTAEHFRQSLVTNLFAVITGFIILTILLIVALVSCIGVIRKQMRFIPFHVIHWSGAALAYIILIIHGVNYYNPSFWKWLLPALVLVVLDRLYWIILTDRFNVEVKSAAAYDDVSRVAIIETDKPKGFKFEAGQYVLLRMPWIGYFSWHPIHISSGPKEDKLTMYIPKEGDDWLKEAFIHLKSHPFTRQSNRASASFANGKVPGDDKVEELQPTPLYNLKVDLIGPYGPGCQSIFDYKISTLVCGGHGPHSSKAIIKKFLDYRKGSSCLCGCHPTLSKLYVVWVIPSGNDFEWFTDYLSDLCEDDHIQRYLDIRVFLTNIDSPPDELASALLQLGLKTAGESCTVRRPSQPQLNNLYQMTSYGLPDFDALLGYIYLQHSNLWNEREMDFGVFSIGDLHHSMRDGLLSACTTRSKPGQVIFKPHHIVT